MDKKQDKSAGKNEAADIQPNYDGDTFVTSHRRKTGVGNEPPVIDAREEAEE